MVGRHLLYNGLSRKHELFIGYGANYGLETKETTVGSLGRYRRTNKTWTVKGSSAEHEGGVGMTESCPYGWEDCYQDDYESMCDDCKVDRAEHIADMRNDRD